MNLLGHLNPPRRGWKRDAAEETFSRQVYPDCMVNDFTVTVGRETWFASRVGNPPSLVVTYALDDDVVTGDEGFTEQQMRDIFYLAVKGFEPCP